METFIDIQGFQDNNKKFILKEIAVLTSHNELQHFIVIPPYSFHMLSSNSKNTVKWLYRNHHGHKWDDGNTKFVDVVKFLKKYINNCQTVYVKGLEKKLWLSQVLNHPEIIDLMDIKPTTIKKLRKTYLNIPRCISHNGICAVENVFILRAFITESSVLAEYSY